jgi:CheY-like chemotaxis protein
LPSTQGSPKPRRSTILVVDDEPDALEILRLYLEYEGFAVVTALDAREALARIEEHRPDLMITDHLMPGITGRALCEILRERADTRHLPIILYSATVPTEPDGRVWDRRFVKPVDLDTLGGEVQRLLGQSAT